MMNKYCCTIAAIAFIVQAHTAYGQGWHATLELNFGSGSRPLYSVEHADVLFSGATAYRGSAGSTVTFNLYGQGTPTGELWVTASGRSDNNEMAYINVSYEPPLEYYCEPIFFDIFGPLHEHVSGVLTIYPRLEISFFTEECNRIYLETYSCAPSYTWEVSDHATGPYVRVQGMSTSRISLTGSDMPALGLKKYGLKFLRVTGPTGTTSAVVPVYLFAPGPNASFSFKPPTCHNGADGHIKININSLYPEVINDFVVTVSVGGSIIQQPFLHDANEITIHALPAGSYKIKIENNSLVTTYGNCFTEYEVGPLPNPGKVVLSNIKVSDYNGYSVSCANANDGNIQVTASGGSGTFPLYQWTPAVSETHIADQLTSGLYKIKVTDSNGCASESYSVPLEGPQKLEVTLLSTGGKGGYAVSCHDKRDGEITAEAKGGVPQYTYVWNTGVRENSLNDLGPGHYSVTVTDRNDCRATASIALTAPAPLSFEVDEISSIHCAGEKTGSLEVQNLQNGIGQLSYLWSSGESSPAISGKKAGQYSVTVSDANGCTATRSATLTEPASYDVSLETVSDYNGSPISCHGVADGRVRAVVTNDAGTIAPAQYYTWYRNGEQITSGALTDILGNIDSGTYRVKVLYNQFCETEDTLNVHAPPPLVAVVTPVTNYHGFPVSCHGAADGTLKATVTGGTGTYDFLWESGETNAIRAGVPAGAYTLKVRDRNGCEASTTTSIASPQKVEAQVSLLSDYNGAAISCAGAADARLRVSAQGGVSGYRYLWDTGATTAEISGVGAQRISVTATDANGCLATDEIVLSEPDPLEAIIEEASDYHGFGVSCHEGRDGFLRATAHGGTGSYYFIWDGTAHSERLFTNLSEGDYNVVVTDQNGCTSSTRAILSSPPPLLITGVSVQNVSCHGGEDAQLEISGSGGIGPYAYAAPGSQWQAENIIMGLKAGDHEIRIRDKNGCSMGSYFTIEQPQPIVIELSEVWPAVCGEARGEIGSSVSGGTGAYVYRWSDAGGVILSDKARLTGQPAGVYTLTVSDANQCEASQTAGITATDGPALRTGTVKLPTCSYSANGSAAVEVTGGDAPFIFRWQNGQTSPEATGLAAGTHFVQVTDANGCSAVQDILIGAPDVLEVILKETSSPTCYGACNGRISVTATGGSGEYTFVWNGTEGPELNNLCAGEYHVKVSDQNQCEAEKTFSLVAPEALQTRLLVSRGPRCAGGCDGYLQMEASGGTGKISYSWNTGHQEASIDNLCKGPYTVTLKDENDCVNTETFILQEPAERVVDLGGSTTLCEGQTYTLDAGSFWETHRWGSSRGLNESGQQITISEAGIYWLEAITSQGCVARDTFRLHTSKDLLRANFLLPSEATIPDTVVAIDISWPLPDGSLWFLPEQMIRLADHGDIIYGTFDAPGSYEVTLQAWLGECRDEMTKTITIFGDQEPEANGRSGEALLLTDFTLYPNPNDGVFDIRAEFTDRTPVVFSIWNTLTATRVFTLEDQGQKTYLKHFDLRPLSAGTYLLRLNYGKQIRYLRFMVR